MRGYAADGAAGPHVAILMATCNGARFLGDQLASIAAQTHGNWSLWVSDDGSTDATATIVRAFAAAHPSRRVTLLEGPGRGSTENFLALIARPDLSADFFAFADQDDVWLPDKIARAVAATASGPRPCLYGARTIVTDERLRPLALSPRFPRAPGFRNALVQSIAGGNTMLLNAAARDLVLRALCPARPVAHDWWLYQIVCGAGGEVIHDSEPRLLYRQHGANQVGANRTLPARFRRLRALLDGRFALWNEANIRALEGARHLLSADSRQALDAFAALRGLRGLRAWRALRAAGLYRQTAAGEVSLSIAAMLGRL